MEEVFGKRVLKHLQESQQVFDVILDNQSLCSSLLDIQKFYPLAVTIHHPIYIPTIPNKKPKSPTLLTINAFIAAALAEGFLYQKPISK